MQGFVDTVHTANQWALIAALFLLLLVFEELGFRVGRTRRGEYDDDARSNYGNLMGGLYGLMGLLLAFTFAMAQSRFDVRRDLVVDEANAIGTAWLRAEFLPAGERDALRGLFVRYVEVRTARDLSSVAAIGAAVAESERLQTEIWARTAAAAAANPTPLSALLVAAVNDVIDSHGKRIAAGRNHVPPIVTVLVFAFGLAAAMITGYRCGIGPRRYRLPSIVLLLLVALVIWVIVDLDRPRRGLIMVDQTPLTDLYAAIRPR